MARASAETKVIPKAEPKAEPDAPAPSIAWSCQAHEAAADGKVGDALADQKSLTVGEKFWLECSGPSVHLDAKTLALRVPKGAEHVLRLLRVGDFGDGHALLLATSYVVGDVKPIGLALVDKTTGVRLEGVSVKMQSVIDAKENPERKAYGPFEPMKISYPAWLWLALALVMAACLAATAIAIARRAKRSAFSKALAGQPIVGTPYSHFNKEMRQLNRRFPAPAAGRSWSNEAAREFVSELDRSYRWFLSRKLKSSFLVGKPDRALRDLARAGKIQRGPAKSVTSIFSELQRALRGDAKIGWTDAHQLFELCRSSADSVEAGVGQ